MKNLLFLCLLLCSSFAQAQDQKATSFTGCATDALHNSNPNLTSNQQQLDQQRYQYLMNKGKKPGQGGTNKALETVPVVVHVIHNNGPENISDAQVVQAIANINTKFAANPGNQIQFCLAQRDPNGNATTGITRNVSPLTVETMEVDDIALKDINRWPPTCYVNIWVVAEILSLSSGNGVVGYAYLPSAHGQPMDGVVIEANFFGSSFDNDAVGTHELGHYFGLYHTFEGGCANSNCLLQGDQVCDTPPDQTTFASCNPSANSCSTDADDPSANNPFSADATDLSNDYMDYSNFSCYNLFTPDQHDRMHYFLTTTRQSLLNCLSCLPPCPAPITADITAPASSMSVLTGTSVSFTATTNGTGEMWYIDPLTILGTGTSLAYTFASPGTYWMKFRVPGNDPTMCLDGLDSVMIVVNEPVVVSCGGSLEFLGTNDAAALPDNQEYISSNGFTWECWFRLTTPLSAAGQTRVLICAVDNVVYEDICLGFGWGGFGSAPGDHLIFRVDAPNASGGPNPNMCDYIPPGGFVPGTWYHAAGVMDYANQTSYLYVNGQLVDTRSVNSPPFNRIISSRLSWDEAYTPGYPGPPLGGNMDEVRIWNRPLTAAEVLANYDQCMSGNEQNLELYYRCNQSAGTTAVDASPNGNNGTLTNGASWSTAEPGLQSPTCATNCVEICGNGIDDNADGIVDENCDCDPVFAGNDTTACAGYTVQLSATPGFDSYNWTPSLGLDDPTSPNPTATVGVTTDYTVIASSLGPELVVNGDFALGTFGFTNGMTNSSVYSPCNSYVGDQWFANPFYASEDHTATTDNMMLCIDGCYIAPTVIWEETIMGLAPATNYKFAFWATRADQVQPDFEIHFIGDVTGDDILATQPGIPWSGAAPWEWDEYGIPAWNSASNTTVTIRIVNTELNSFGNDYGVDDFSFRQACVSTDVVHITAVNGTPQTLDLGPDLQVCEGGIHIFDAGPGFLEYHWNDGSTGQTYTAHDPGTYWVTTIDSCGGMQTDTVHITLAPDPQIELGDDQVFCPGGSVILGYTSGDAFTSFLWTPATGLSCTTCPNPTAIATAATTYYLYASTAQGCIAVDSVVIEPGTEAPLDVEVTVTDQGCVEAGNIHVTGFGTYQTSINGGDFTMETVFHNLEQGTYHVTVQSLTSMCSFDTTVTITGELPALYIPNSFTPNGDQINQNWKIEGNCIGDLDCHIYNRWGEEIAFLDDPEDEWDGTYNGINVPDGVYIYVVVIYYDDGQVYTTNGHVTVLR